MKSTQVGLVVALIITLIGFLLFVYAGPIARALI